MKRLILGGLLAAALVAGAAAVAPHSNQVAELPPRNVAPAQVAAWYDSPSRDVAPAQVGEIPGYGPSLNKVQACATCAWYDGVAPDKAPSLDSAPAQVGEIPGYGPSQDGGKPSGG